MTPQKLNKRVAFVREVISEVAGFSPYEKRVMELLKVGKEKRALKLLKVKLGALPSARCVAAPAYCRQGLIESGAERGRGTCVREPMLGPVVSWNVVGGHACLAFQLRRHQRRTIDQRVTGCPTQQAAVAYPCCSPPWRVGCSCCSSPCVVIERCVRLGLISPLAPHSLAGTHKRAKTKRENMANELRKQRMKQ